MLVVFSTLRSEIPSIAAGFRLRHLPFIKSDQILSMYSERESIPLTQRWVCRSLPNYFPYRLDILRWERSFWEIGNLAQRGRSGRLITNQENIKIIDIIFKMTLHVVFVMLPTWYPFPCQRRKAFLELVSFCIRTSCEIFKFFLKGDSEKRLEFAEPCLWTTVGYSEYSLKNFFADVCMFGTNGVAKK